MITVRYLNNKQNEEEPREFSSWKEFYKYVYARWDRNERNFKASVRVAGDDIYRWNTFQFVMIIVATGGDAGVDQKTY